MLTVYPILNLPFIVLSGIGLFYGWVGYPGMLNALSKHRNKILDKPNVIYQKELLEKAVTELKKQFPAFDTLKVFRES